jgi:kynurenine formamidase
VTGSLFTLGDKLKQKRVFYVGLPIKIIDLDSSWNRAIVLEDP